jgi:hypothetical protein
MTKKGTIPIKRSRRGLPCLWEAGGGFTNTGRAIIIADKHGRPKSPIYVRGGGSLSCAEHALIPIEVGDYVIKAHHHRKDFEIVVYRILNIGEEEAEVEIVMDYRMNEWAPQEPSGDIAKAVEAARQKATCYHCRKAHYIS